MTNNIITISGQSDAFDTIGVIERLEGLLERARAGKIDGIAYVEVSRDGGFTTGWEGIHGTRGQLSLGISCLSLRYTQAVVDEN